MPQLALYYYDACPYCRKVNQVIRSQKMNVHLRNVQTSRKYHKELLNGGGRAMVPCLKIEDKGQKTRWMYESDDIIRYLKKAQPTGKR